MKKKVVVSQSRVTAGQLKDLFRMIDDGTVHYDNLKGFLANPHRFTRNQSSFIRALKILGEQRVFTPERVAEKLNPLRKRAGLQLLTPPKGASIPYSDSVLKEVQKLGGNWRLVYSYGLSLREQRLMVGTDKNQQPRFYTSAWWLKDEESHWATKGVKPGWHLVDMDGRFQSQSWQTQEESIQKLGKEYKRADEHLIGEVILSAYLINNGERLLEDFYHWGKALGSDGDHVSVGYFDRDGLDVSNYRPGWDDYSSLRVCVLRKLPNDS